MADSVATLIEIKNHIYSVVNINFKLSVPLTFCISFSCEGYFKETNLDPFLDTVNLFNEMQEVEIASAKRKVKLQQFICLIQLLLIPFVI